MFLFVKLLLQCGGIELAELLSLSGQLDDFVTGMDRILVAADAGIRANRERVPGGDQSHGRTARTRAGVHMAIAALQTGIGVCAVREAIAAFLVTIAAQGCNGLGFRSLGMWVVAVFAYDPSGAVNACAPFVGGLLMALRTQFGVRRH